MPRSTINDRLTRIARYWQFKFRLPDDQFDDLLQSAWELWLKFERYGEHRISQVWKRLYNVAVREVYGKTISRKLPSRPVYVDLSELNGERQEETYVDYNNRVLLREIVDAAFRRDGNNCKRAQTLCKMIEGKASKIGVERMRKFLRQERLEA